MPNYLRLKIPGATYFFTVNTYQRQLILTSEIARKTLRVVWNDVSQRYPFKTEAICLLPDHIHCIWRLPEGDADFSIRWSEIKRLFSAALRTPISQTNKSASRINRGESHIWQRRFWEHVIRDDTDYYHHLDYIHFNPVKHGYVRSVADWRWSSFHKYVSMGYYEKNWGQEAEVINLKFQVGE
jgi:putative transposase